MSGPGGALLKASRRLRAVLAAVEERIIRGDLPVPRPTVQRELRAMLDALERPQAPRIGRRRPLGHD